MTSILIFGASGPVGQFLLPQLFPHFRVVAVSRTGRHGWLRGDLNATGIAWPPAEIVISLGPLDAFAGWLGREAPPGMRRLIAFSSMSADSKRDSPDADERELAARLAEAEASVIAACATRSIACTLFRPTLIYGAGKDRSLAPIARFARRWRVLPLALGATGLRQPVHAADLAAACMATLDNPVTYTKTYALGGGEALAFNAMLLRLRECAGGHVLPLPLPAWLLRVLARSRPEARIARAALARLRAPLLADNTAAARDFGYAPRDFHGREVLPD
jgi:nucleoside-diphosphate-sugar epimerase